MLVIACGEARSQERHPQHQEQCQLCGVVEREVDAVERPVQELEKDQGGHSQRGEEDDGCLDAIQDLIEEAEDLADVVHQSGDHEDQSEDHLQEDDLLQEPANSCPGSVPSTPDRVERREDGVEGGAGHVRSKAWVGLHAQLSEFVLNSLEQIGAHLLGKLGVGRDAGVDKWLQFRRSGCVYRHAHLLEVVE